MSSTQILKGLLLKRAAYGMSPNQRRRRAAESDPSTMTADQPIYATHGRSYPDVGPLWGPWRKAMADKAKASLASRRAAPPAPKPLPPPTPTGGLDIVADWADTLQSIPKGQVAREIMQEIMRAEAPHELRHMPRRTQ